MTRAFSDDLRSRALAASRDGLSARSGAARFGIGISTAIAWIARARAGQLTPATQGRRRGSRLDAHEGFIIRIIEEEKDITLDEMVLRLRENRAVSRPSQDPRCSRADRSLTEPPAGLPDGVVWCAITNNAATCPKR